MQRAGAEDVCLEGHARLLQRGVDVQLIVEALLLHEPRNAHEPQGCARPAQRLESGEHVEPAVDGVDFRRIGTAGDKELAAHFRRSVNEPGVRDFLHQPPVAAVLVKIVGVRACAVGQAEDAPKHPTSSGGRAGPRAVHERGRILAKLVIVAAGEAGPEHVLPEIQPRRRPPRKHTDEEVGDQARAAQEIPRDDEQEKRDEPPLRKRAHRQPAEIAAAAPERIESQIHAARLQRHDFTLEKRFGRFGKRREQERDGRRSVGQDETGLTR